jgi:hypothetical protein
MHIIPGRKVNVAKLIQSSPTAPLTLARRLAQQG